MVNPTQWLSERRAESRTPAAAAGSRLNQYGDEYLAVLKQIFGRFLSPSTRTVIEYGTGASTALLIGMIDDAFGEKRPDDLVLMSIDNNEDWQRKIAKDLPFRRYLHLRTYDLTGAVQHEADTGFNYATAPALLGRPIDLAYVDGRTRAQCALFVAPRLAESGAIILDDAARERYRFLDDFFESVEEVGRFKIFQRPKVRAAPASARTARTAIVQVAVGEQSRRELAVSGESVSRYARRIGADHVVLTESPADWPQAAVKFVAYDAFLKYERCVLLDVDTIIRDGAPDLFVIVPETHVGGVAEGSLIPPDLWQNNPRRLYDLGPDYDPRRYINTGLVVMSQPHYDLYKLDASRKIFGDPALDQAYVNAEIFRRRLPLYELPKEFNAISTYFNPHPPDWRYGWINHLAGSWLHSPLVHPAFWASEGQAEGMEVLRQRPAKGGAARLPRLQGLARAIKEEAHLATFVPLQFHVFDDRRLEYRSDLSTVVCNLFGDPDALVMYGPYIALEASAYEIEITVAPGASPFAFAIDVARDRGAAIVTPKTVLRSTGSLVRKFTLNEPADDIEFRLYGADGRDSRLIAITLRWL